MTFRIAPPLWTAQQDAELQRLQAEGLSCAQIAKRMGAVSRNAVIARANRLRGIKFPSDIARIKAAKLQRIQSRRERAALQKVVTASASQALRNGRTRVSVIREMVRAGLSGAAVGKYFGVTRQRIAQIMESPP